MAKNFNRSGRAALFCDDDCVNDCS